MKNFYVLTSVALFIVACSENTMEKTRNTPSQMACLTAVRYLDLDKDSKMYSLNLTGEQAIKLGISQSDYHQMLRELNNVNDFISSFESSYPDAPLDLTDPKITKRELTEDNVQMLKTRSETANSSSLYVKLSPYDSNWEDKSAFIPVNANVIDVSCSSVGFIQGFNFSIETSGETVHGGSVGVLGAYNTTIKPAYTGVRGTFAFKTTNSNGGTCVFQYK